MKKISDVEDYFFNDDDYYGVQKSGHFHLKLDQTLFFSKEDPQNTFSHHTLYITPFSILFEFYNSSACQEI